MATVVDTFLNVEPIDFDNLAHTGIKKDMFKGDVAVVTGAASNIGLGYARALAWAGAKVVISDLNAENGAEAERVINEENGGDVSLFVKTDVSQESDMKNLAAKAFEKFGKVDMLINNAMNMRLNGPVLKSPVSDLEQSFAISAKGVMLAIKEFVPGMIERKHGVVTYSATQLHYMPPMFGGTIYTAGKACATSLVLSLANELGPAKDSGIGVFCLTPAGVGRFDFSKMPPPPPDAPPMPPPPPDAPPLDMSMFGMPGFNSMIPPEAGGAAMLYCILNAEKLHGSGFIINDAFVAMDYPFPNQKTAPKRVDAKRLTHMELTMAFCNVGPGFYGSEY